MSAELVDWITHRSILARCHLFVQMLIGSVSETVTEFAEVYSVLPEPVSREVKGDFESSEERRNISLHAGDARRSSQLIALILAIREIVRRARGGLGEETSSDFAFGGMVFAVSIAARSLDVNSSAVPSD